MSLDSTGFCSASFSGTDLGSTGLFALPRSGSFNSALLGLFPRPGQGLLTLFCCCSFSGARLLRLGSRKGFFSLLGSSSLGGTGLGFLPRTHKSLLSLLGSCGFGGSPSLGLLGSCK